MKLRIVFYDGSKMTVENTLDELIKQDAAEHTLLNECYWKYSETEVGTFISSRRITRVRTNDIKSITEWD